MGENGEDSDEDVLRALCAYARYDKASVYADTVDAALPQAVFMPLRSDVLHYVKCDVQQLLDDFVLPRLHLVEELWQRMRAWLRRGQVGGKARRWMREAQTRALDEYLSVRRRMVPRIGAFTAMAETQQLALLFLFQCALGFRVLHQRIEASYEGVTSAVERPAPDFDYVEYVARHRGGLVLANAGDTALEDFDLSQWHTAMNLLLKALHVVGSGNARAANGDALPSAVPYWEALWERYAMFLFDADGPTRHPPAVAVPAGGAPILRTADVRAMLAEMGLADAALAAASADGEGAGLAGREFNLKYATEPVAVQSDVQKRRLTRALPYVRGGRRLCLAYCQRAESIFHTHQQRFAALEAFAEAVRGCGAESEHAARMLATRAPHLGEQVAAFIDEMAHHANDMVDRYVSEELWATLSNAYLMAGEPEQFVLLALNDASRATGVAPVQTTPLASEVISTLRGDEFAAITRYERLPVLFAKVVEEFLPTVTRPPLVAAPSERAGVMLLTVIMDANMTYAGCPAARLLSHCAYVDELAHGFRHIAGHSAKAAQATLEEGLKRQQVPASPRDALDAFNGATTRCVLVRLMRRNFLVLARPNFVAAPLVVELPSYPLAAVAWLACACAPRQTPTAEFIPSVFQSTVVAMRAR